MINENSIKVFAPGKIILSGEHAVVYGKPALAMAVNRYASATITKARRAQVLFDLADFAHQGRTSFEALQQLKARLKRKYQKFVRGEYGIRDVLQKPFELAQFALSLITESHQASLPSGVKIRLDSSIPIGCGMGSSAATILSVMHAVSHYMQIPLNSDTLFNLALEAENLQHGRSSGLDLRVAMQGGCLYMHGDQFQSRTLPNFKFYLVNTGTPECSTGQCVEKAAAIFKSSPSLADDFEAITKAMDQAIQAASDETMRTCMQENQRLLERIGIVPTLVQQFIQEITAHHGSAKICGAGAICGDKAGVLLVLMDDSELLSAICQRYNYEILPIIGEARGLHVI